MLKRLGVPYSVNPTFFDVPAEFVLFFQSYPHEFTPAELACLRQRNPAAPFFFVLGTCCEGIGRTAGLPYSSLYSYVHGWSDRDIAPWFSDAPYSDCSSVKTVNAGTCLILTHFGPLGNDSAMNQLIADEQRQLGFTPNFAWNSLPETFSGAIFADADDSPREKILNSLQRLRRRFADNDCTVYVDSPRIDEKNDYFEAGVSRVLPKMR